MEKKNYDLETERQMNEYEQFVNTFIDGFSAQMWNDGIIDDVKPEQLKKYFNNPDEHQELLSNITEYFYLSSGEIHIMYELLEALPTLNYKVDTHDTATKPKNHDKYISQINKHMHKVKHRTLTRDILKQVGSSGVLTGIWLGEKNKLFPYIFDSPKYVFPAYRKGFDWVVQFDLKYLDEFQDFYQQVLFDNLNPYVTKSMYRKYKDNPTNNDTRYVTLPTERTFAINTHTLKRNQPIGSSWANPSLFDILHKRKMKNVERSIANKIINSIAVLTIGSDKNDGAYANMKLGKGVKTKIHAGVKKALEENQKGGVPVVAVPEYATLEFPEVKTDGLDGDKFDNLNSDINASLGLSGAVTNGESGNNASAKINLEVLYKRIGVLLEKIETEIFQKMVNLLLPAAQEDNYFVVYDKDQPLSRKDKVDILKGLNDKGWSSKHLIDELEGVTWESYLEQTLHETESLKLQSKIVPYMSSHTTSGNSNGAPEKDEKDLTDEGDATRSGEKND
ncbi:hypothetical protein [Halobacillus litoralis]|uniref:hypothetical protein n=1 Tax=Halobacillus litoralis TaxID=45668 RepID=UPI001CD41646|nr:hypothetical protein [Halobacillus litoralis]MCA1021637.1 hypothetical protein [Halobacillus litoralis]